jgi:hypothetical protein
MEAVEGATHPEEAASSPSAASTTMVDVVSLPLGPTAAK